MLKAPVSGSRTWMCTMAAPAVAAATAAAAICSGVIGQCGLLVTLVSSPVMAQVMKTSWFMTMPAAGKYYDVDNIIMGDTAASRGMLRRRARWRSYRPSENIHADTIADRRPAACG